MAFKFKARVLLELGAELISSDAVALYELIKNSLDAQSASVTIEIRIALQHSTYSQLRSLLQQHLLEESNKNVTDFNSENFNNAVYDALEDDATETTRQRFLKAYGKPKKLRETLAALDQAYFNGNYIAIKDTGIGMSTTSLSENYLTVGTPGRLLEKNTKIAKATSEISRLKVNSNATKLPLGEKGIGRLSAMRLGHFVKVKSKTAEENSWNLLELDWRPIFNDPTLDASAIDFPIKQGKCLEEEIDSQGTSIYIRDLQTDWSEEKVRRIAATDLAKIQNPFASLNSNQFIKLIFQNLDEKKQSKNNETLIPRPNREALLKADAVCTAKFLYDDQDEPQLSLHVDYKQFARERTEHIKGDHLRACVREEPGRKKKRIPLLDGEIIARALKHLGPWELKFHWFNRGRIMRETPEIYTNLVEPFLIQWGGGFLVYRDGYRVYPYGERSDDWLDLDRKALAASAYKLNRAQMAGTLLLTSIGNPSLLDQTNREGFRDSYDREALKRLLRYVILGFCRPFLEQIEKEVEEPIEQVVEDVQKRISTSKDVALNSLRGMQARLPEEKNSIEKVRFHLEEVSEAWERAKLRIKSFEQTMDSYVHLASIGLMLEFVSHELSRVTQDSLRAVAAGNFSPEVVEAQLRTLDRRVRLLDELSIPGRQIRKPVDILEAIHLLREFHASKSERHNITVNITTTNARRALVEVVEKGQILQIMDNLFSNSFYWITNRLEQDTEGRIDIEINPDLRTVKFTDNGPGIPSERAETIFDQFVTTKPPRAGRGLGLYIARRLANENGAELFLSGTESDGMHRTFVLDFKK